MAILFHLNSDPAAPVFPFIFQTFDGKQNISQCQFICKICQNHIGFAHYLSTLCF